MRSVAVVGVLPTACRSVGTVRFGHLSRVKKDGVKEILETLEGMTDDEVAGFTSALLFWLRSERELHKVAGEVGIMVARTVTLDDVLRFVVSFVINALKCGNDLLAYETLKLIVGVALREHIDALVGALVLHALSLADDGALEAFRGWLTAPPAGKPPGDYVELDPGDEDVGRV